MTHRDNDLPHSANFGNVIRRFAMPQSLSNVLVHIVFSTKERRAMLRGRELAVEMHKYLGGISNSLDCPPIIAEEMHKYLGGISNSLDCPPIIAGGTDDHVHLLARQARTIALADWIKELKRGSSIWIKTKGPALELFQWQAGYGAFSVSQSQSERVQRYIAGQEQHHARLSFQDEFRQLLRKHGIEFDERYVWD
jgi:putative transposase